MAALTLDQVLKAAQAGEDSDWEFKSAKGGLPGSLWDTYSAMANTEGGWILLGAREDNGIIHLDGLPSEAIAKLTKALWDNLHNRRQISANLLAPSDVQQVPLDGSSLLAIHVPPASASQRPIYVGSNPFGHTFRRRHEGDYRCTDAEVRRMLADADPIPPDHRILTHFTLADLDAHSLTQYRQRFQLVKSGHAWLNLGDRELLENLGGWRTDRESGQSGLTVAGLLMFGKDLAIRDAAALPEYFVDYREKLDPEVRWTDRVYPDGTWEANLFQFYQRVWPKLAMGLPVPFRLEGGIRRDETPAHVALREAFINALIHADYSAPGGIVLERYPDRFVFDNPGILMVSFQQFRRGGISACRNKALQRMFLMIGGGEQAGSGVDKIRQGWKSNHWRPPRIERTSEPDRIRLTLPMASLIPDDTLNRLKAMFGSGLAALHSDELQALATADLEEGVSNGRLQDMVTRHPVDIGRMLQALCERGFLVSDKRGRWTTYRLSRKLPDSPSLFGEGDSPHLAGNSPHLAGNSPHLTPSSSHLAGNSPHLAGNSPQSSSRTREELESPASQVEIISRVATSRRATATEVRQAILALCDGTFLSSEGIAKALNRSHKNIRERFLTPMAEEGMLRLRYPNTPNRPDQTYTKADGKA